MFVGIGNAGFFDFFEKKTLGIVHEWLGHSTEAQTREVTNNAILNKTNVHGETRLGEGAMFAYLWH